MENYNLKNIMITAWKIFRKGSIQFADALRMAWANAKAYRAAKESSGITEETHTWSGWLALGCEVMHQSRALFKVVYLDQTTKNGTRVHSFFGASQVLPIRA